jgi:hypothetical protein
LIVGAWSAIDELRAETMMTTDTISAAWGWSGLVPVEIVTVNDYGNVILLAKDGSYWRICPEEWSCEQIANDQNGIAALSRDDDFQLDWRMDRLVELAHENLGPLTEGRCYCLKLPAIIGGKYEADNIGTISLEELIAYSGNMAERIQDVPDGGRIQIELVD